MPCEPREPVASLSLAHGVLTALAVTSLLIQMRWLPEEEGGGGFELYKKGGFGGFECLLERRDAYRT